MLQTHTNTSGEASKKKGYLQNLAVKKGRELSHKIHRIFVERRIWCVKLLCSKLWKLADGPTLLFLGPYENLMDVNQKIQLKNDEYVRRRNSPLRSLVARPLYLALRS